MKAHLTSDEINAWTIGERSPEAQAHVCECHECRDELLRLEQTLAGFKQSVQAWGGAQISAKPLNLSNRSVLAGWFRPACCAVAAMAMLMLLTFKRNEPPAAIETAQSSAADDALLLRLDRQISATVPGPMEPLTRLVSWDGVKKEYVQ